MDKLYLGIDIGGTHTRAVLLNGLKKQKPNCFVIDTLQNKKDFLDVLRKFIESIIRGKKITGLGAGLPGIIDPKRGILSKAQNLPFLDGWDAEKFFKQFGALAKIDNDCRCFLRAETEWGSAQGYKNVIGIAIGTGIGGGIMLEGKMYAGSHNSAGEFGHTIIDVV
ncbi:MAG: ROK family protein, partial [Patescibacteria group bacterium]